MKQARRGEKKLRIGRISVPGARYFITICTSPRTWGLESVAIGETIIEAFRQLHRERSIELLCATVMPDHIHCLYRLGSRLTLSQVQGRFKVLTKPELAEAGLRWQSNFRDHQLRPDTSSEDFARYIFLNPYQKALVPPREGWPWWVCSKKFRPEFIELLDRHRCPLPEWIDHSPGPAELIAAEEKDHPRAEVLQGDL